MCKCQIPSVSEFSTVVRRSLKLYWTLVDRGLLPDGFEREFKDFGHHWEAAAERDDERKSRWDNVKAAVELHSRRKLQQDRDVKDKYSQDQFMLAAVEKPT